MYNKSMVKLSPSLDTKKIPQSVGIEQWMLEWCRDTAVESGLSVSEVVNRAIRVFIRSHDEANKDVSGDVMIEAYEKELHPRVIPEFKGRCKKGYSVKVASRSWQCPEEECDYSTCEDGRCPFD